MIIIDSLLKQINENLFTILVSIIIIIICYNDNVRLKMKYEIIEQLRDKTYRKSVQYIFDNGYPELEYKQISMNSTQPNSQHSDNEYSITVLELQIVSNIDTYRHAALEFASSVSCKIRDGGRICYATESDVQGFVKDVMYEVLNASGILSHTNIFNEITIINFQTDIWMVMIDKYLPLCVIEVKKPCTNGYSLLSNRNIVSQLFDYMISCEAYHGVSPIFGILTDYNEWNILAFDDIISREILFKSVEANNKIEYSLTTDDSNILYDNDNDEKVSRNLIVSQTIKGTDPLLIRYLVSIMMKCYNRRRNGSTTTTLVSLLQNNRIILKIEKDHISWIQLPKLIQQLSILPPSFTNYKTDSKQLLKSFLLLRDYGEGRDGKAWLGCNKNGNLIVLKFFKVNIEVSTCILGQLPDEEDAIDKECKMWNKLYGANTAISLELQNQLVLIMPFVFCCIYNKQNKAKHFNTTLQPSYLINFELLELDLQHVKEFSSIRDEINKTCNPDEIAHEIIDTIAKKRYIHKDIAWRHIGVRPMIISKDKKKSMKFRFEPTIIDLTSIEVADPKLTIQELVDEMMKQLHNSELEN